MPPVDQTTPLQVEVADRRQPASPASCMADLAQARPASTSFAVLEKADRVGGTWRENTYPGAACDVPSHLYSFSFAPNPTWTRAFSPQVRDPRLPRARRRRAPVRRPHRHFHAEVAVQARFDEPRLDAGPCKRRRRTASSRPQPRPRQRRPPRPRLPRHRRPRQEFHRPVLPLGPLGPLRRPHRGRRVAVIGTGASAIQIVPQLAPKVAAKLHLFQRTAPPGSLPKPDHPIGRAGPGSLYARAPAPPAARSAPRLYWQPRAGALPRASTRPQPAGKLAEPLGAATSRAKHPATRPCAPP
jgi:hypothetical protein